MKPRDIKQEIVEEFRKRWANAFDANGMNAAYVLVEDNLEASLSRLEAAAIESVLSIRCMPHRFVEQLNANEAAGGECGACIKAATEARIVEEIREKVEVLHETGDSAKRNLLPYEEILALLPSKASIRDHD